MLLILRKCPPKKAPPSVFEQTDLNLHQKNCCDELFGHRWMFYFWFYFYCLWRRTCSTDSVDHTCSRKTVVFLLKISSRYVDCLFFFSPRLEENPAYAHIPGNPTKCTWTLYFWFGGNENNTIFSYFQNFQIFFPETY